MWEFLTFKTFITPYVLIVFYYLGVIFLPLLSWVYRKKIAILYNAYQSKNRLSVVLVLITFFLMMQLIWRMMFETIIGYFDMHNYLQMLSTP